MMPRNDQVHMLRQNRAGEDANLAFPGGLGKTAGNRPGLYSGQMDWGKLQRLLGSLACDLVVRFARERSASFYLGRRAEAEQLPGTDEI
jgi:hypothetical protein